MEIDLTDPTRRSTLWQIATGVAVAVGGMNLLASALSFWGHRPIRQAFERDTISVPLEIVGVLLLQCATAHAVGALLARGSKTESLAAALPSMAILGLASSWIAVFNIQTLLAPSFIFAIGSVAMVRPPVLVVLVYLACACISFGFTFLDVKNVREDDASGVRAERFSEVACGIQAVFFIALGVLAVIGP
jgi:hypothetical protein